MGPLERARDQGRWRTARDPGLRRLLARRDLPVVPPEPRRVGWLDAVVQLLRHGRRHDEALDPADRGQPLLISTKVGRGARLGKDAYHRSQWRGVYVMHMS